MTQNSRPETDTDFQKFAGETWQKLLDQLEAQQANLAAADRIDWATPDIGSQCFGHAWHAHARNFHRNFRAGNRKSDFVPVIDACVASCAKEMLAAAKSEKSAQGKAGISYQNFRHALDVLTGNKPPAGYICS